MDIAHTGSEYEISCVSLGVLRESVMVAKTEKLNFYIQQINKLNIPELIP
jgi:hypothetical protein